MENQTLECHLQIHLYGWEISKTRRTNKFKSKTLLRANIAKVMGECCSVHVSNYTFCPSWDHNEFKTKTQPQLKTLCYCQSIGFQWIWCRNVHSMIELNCYGQWNIISWNLYWKSCGAVVCTMKLQKNKKVSAALLYWTLHANWWDNNLLEVLVVL